MTESYKIKKTKSNIKIVVSNLATKSRRISWIKKKSAKQHYPLVNDKEHLITEILRKMQNHNY
jgi:hypothetical protein